MQPVLLWFRRNLRLSDNAALIAAVDSGRPLVPFYVLDAEDSGGAARWWLHHSLKSLDRDIRALGSSLVVRRGNPAEVIARLAGETGAEALCYARRCEPASRLQEADIENRLGDSLAIRAFDDSLLHAPETIRTQSDAAYRVFTPFWKAASRLGEPKTPEPVPSNIVFASPLPASAAIEDLELLPTAPAWDGGLRDTWSPGESAGLDCIDELETTLANYEQHRDRPDIEGTSRLSPYLAFGEVSVRQVWHGVQRLTLRLRSESSSAALLRQLYWRDFCSYLLFHFPTLPEKPLRSEFEYFPWSDDATVLRAWQRGRTGFPIVDAGMRQLRETGWMHNRVRMIAASFLVKDLLVPWQRGADWFLDNLVDADLASNSANWQWVAGCGTDAAPYFRVFNPSLQGDKFDPQRHYIRRWVPELSDGGADYPAPIVDHAAARQRALDAYASIRGMRASKAAP